ncbi:MAG: hypothetical protein AAGL10_01020 [Pseudomonadota bacterium]
MMPTITELFALLLMSGLAAGCSQSDSVDSENIDSKSVEAGPDPTYLSANARKIGCSIASTFVTAEFDKSDKPIVLTDPGERDFALMTRDEAAGLFTYLIEGDEGDPYSDTIRGRSEAFLTLNTEGVIRQCHALSKINEERSFSPDPSQEVPRLTPDGLFYEYDTLIVSMPLVDLERGQAFMWIGHGCGPLCGETGIEIFTRQTDGDWIRTDYVGLTIS